jgi:hypothetical protein
MKKVIRLTESDLHKIVKESVKRILNESGELIPAINKPKMNENINDSFCTVNVECYDNNDDIVFVCVPTENESKAMSMCRKIGYEPIDVTNGWCNSAGNLTRNEYNLLQKGLVISDKPITSECELDGM